MLVEKFEEHSLLGDSCMDGRLALRRVSGTNKYGYEDTDWICLAQELSFSVAGRYEHVK
jgi:hypothetical protein